MPEFGSKSLSKLRTCHPDLQKLFLEVVKDRDCQILCGFRGKLEQEEAFAKGFSKVQWPHGKHNKIPSLAVDVIPHPFAESDWNNIKLFEDFSEIVKCKISELGLTNITWGGDWESFKDYPHWEIKENG